MPAPTLPTFPASVFGDRVKDIVNLRLSDKVLAAIVNAPFRADEQNNGALFGACEGVLGAAEPTFEVSLPEKRIRFGEMVLVGVQNVSEGSPRATGGVVQYDPTDPHQVTTWVNVASYEGSAGVLWWTPILSDADYGNFYAYAAGFPSGRAMRGHRLSRTRVQFAATTSFGTKPAEGGPWFRLGKFTFPSEGEPVVTFCHAFDQGFPFTTEGTNAKFWLGQEMMRNFSPSGNDGRTFSLSRAFAILVNAILSIKDVNHAYDPVTGIITTAGTQGLLDRVTRGLYQLDTDLEDAETAIETLQAQVAALEDANTALQDRVAEVEAVNAAIAAAPKTLYAADIALAGTVDRQVGAVLSYGVVTVTRPSTGHYVIEFPLALGDAVAVVTPKTSGLTGGRNVNITWALPGELHVDIANESGVDANTAFNIIVSGSL